MDHFNLNLLSYPGQQSSQETQNSNLLLSYEPQFGNFLTPDEDNQQNWIVHDGAPSAHIGGQMADILPDFNFKFQSLCLISQKKSPKSIYQKKKSKFFWAF